MTNEQVCPMCGSKSTVFGHPFSIESTLPFEQQQCSNCSLPCKLWSIVSSAFAAQERLLAGRLTDEEYQNICHNLHACDHKTFVQGCRVEWRKLGITDIIDELSRENQDLRMELLRSERQRRILESQLSDLGRPTNSEE